MNKIYELPIGKLLIIIKKLYKDLNVKLDEKNLIQYGGVYTVEEELKIFGIKSITVKEYSFIVKFIKLNEETLKNETLTKENAIIPELRKVKLRYYQYETYTEEKTWQKTVETYSTDRKVCKQFFQGDVNNAEDSIDIYSQDPDDIRTTDSTIDGDGLHLDNV